jgi:predicted dehydrogenase
LAALAKQRRIVGVVGTQARVAPAIEYLRDLIADGFVGEVLSTTISARGAAGVTPSKASRLAPACSIVPMAPPC